MRSRLTLPSLFGWFVLGAGPAVAGTLTAATWTQVVSPPGGVVLSLTRTGAQLGATGNSTASFISAGLSFPPFATSFFVPKTAMVVIDRHFYFSQGGAQLITATAGGAFGTPHVGGTVVVMDAVHTTMGANQSKFMVGANTLVSVPLGVGRAAQFTQTFSVLGQLGTLTIHFYSWTPGTLTFTGLTYKLAPLPDVVAMGSFDLTSHGGGSVTLVSPSRITVSSAPLFQNSILTLASLKLVFVPEPGTLLLLVGAGLALWGFDRRRR
jgi:hypothetical protein